MSFGIRLHVWGERACFTRPENKAERVSYDVITPSAARGILEAIHWKPAIRWVVERLTVLKPIRFEAIRRNELGSKLSSKLVEAAMAGRGRVEQLIEDDRQQRAGLILRDVGYLIDARFEMTGRAGPGDNPGKHREMFVRRAARGQCFHQPCLGCREFPASFALIEGDPPPSALAGTGLRDLGWMLHDIGFAHGNRAHFFHALMTDGVIEVPPFGQGGAP